LSRIQTHIDYVGSPSEPVKSLFAVAVASNDPCLLNKVSIVDLTGQLPSNFPESGNDGKYGTAAAYADLWGWSQENCVSYDGNSAHPLHYRNDAIDQAEYTTLLSQEWTVKSNRSGTARTVAVNEGYWGPRSFAGRAGEFFNNDSARSAPHGQASISGF
jgi:hypothetical protein